MAEQLMLSIGIGLVVSLLFSELFGLAAGGMVVPGYFALFFDKPFDILVTAAAALLTYWIILLLSNVLIVYGRRRTVLMILVGYLIGFMIRQLVPEVVGLEMDNAPDVIGYIIPGLIAIWLERQGIVETFATLTSAAVVVRLCLILVLGDELIT